LAGYNPATNRVNSGVTASYDTNGNMLTNSWASFSWNATGQPSVVNGIDATYDALGRLAELQAGSTYTEFIYRPSGDKLAVMNGSTLLKSVITLPGGATAVYNASGLDFVRHKDWLGSARLDTTWAHAVYSKEAYAPFGETYNEAGTADRSFTGQDQDTTQGIYDYYFRRYDSVAGRWLSPDPAGWGSVSLAYPQSLDAYAYVQNQPSNATDPEGLSCIMINGVTDDNGDGYGCMINGVMTYSSVFFFGICGGGDYTCAEAWLASATGTQNAPNNTAPAKSWWQKNWDCVANVGLPVIANDLNPFSLGVGTAADATSQMSQASLEAAATWSVQQGLTVPLRSSIVRAGVSSAEALGEASGVLALLSVEAALVHAAIAEHSGCTF
jgi:RHS repeat-associated protein